MAKRHSPLLSWARLWQRGLKAAMAAAPAPALKAPKGAKKAQPAKKAAARKPVAPKAASASAKRAAKAAAHSAKAVVDRAVKTSVKAAVGAAPALLKPSSLRRVVVAPAARGAGQWVDGMAFSRPLQGGVGTLGAARGTGMRRYRIYKPAGLRADERVPLLMLLHGCGQDADGFAASTRLHTLADRQRLCLLLVEQDRLANAQGCWNWFDTRHGRAQAEMALLMGALDDVCRLYPVDAQRVLVAGLSAGASMAALLASTHPQRFAAVVMHSGVPPGMADSPIGALGAMRGRSARRLLATAPARPQGEAAITPGAHDGPLPPPLLVIHGDADTVVSPDNGHAAAQLWAEACGARPRPARVVQRGQRHPMRLTDYTAPGGRLAAVLAEVAGLGHAWSGGHGQLPFGDPQGPDAGAMIWAFGRRVFAQRGRDAGRWRIDALAVEQEGTRRRIVVGEGG
ncbi:MAG: hypothetical protein RLY78_283 [Pseudomonadota bacterium]